MVLSHYIGRWPGVCVLTLALKRVDAAIGVVVFALPPRETARRYGAVTWELARLWVDDRIPANAESYVIGRAIRYVRARHPEVGMLVSYADPSAGHTGAIYKATNWLADGMTDDERRSPRCDYADASTGKRYSRRSHLPPSAAILRVPRVSKYRFIYPLIDGAKVRRGE
jgi:hypothetical protein